MVSQQRIDKGDEGSVDPAEGWARFASASDAHAFCQGWLSVQCGEIAGARAALLILESEDQGRFAPAAIWPNRRHDVTYLASAAERALEARRGLVLPVPDRDSAGSRANVALPIEIRGELFGAVVIDIEAKSETELADDLRKLQWGAGWLEVLFRRRQSEADGDLLTRAEAGLDLIATVLDEGEPRAAAMALTNALARRTRARTVAVAMRRGRKLEIRAVSDTAFFEKKSELLRASLDAMEEGLDQLAPVSVPGTAGSEGRIRVAHERVRALLGDDGVATVPLFAAGRPVGAILLTFGSDRPLDDDALRLAEAAGAVCGGALADKERSHRWLSGRIPAAIARFGRALRDPGRATGKLALVLVAIAIGALIFGETTLRASGRAVVEGRVQRAVVAPIDGYVQEAPVRAGDLVAEGDLLVRLDDRDLVLEELQLEGQLAQVAQAYRNALAEHDRAQLGLLAAQRDEIAAQLRLVSAQRERLTLRAPLDGLVVSGDLTQRLGTPVEKGDSLFEIAPAGDYRVILEIDERDVTLLELGQEGQLSLAALSDRRLPFTVDAITPVASAVEGRNVYRVEAALVDPDFPLSPGMEGVGKVAVDTAPVLWVWLRPLAHWARHTAWALLP